MDRRLQQLESFTAKGSDGRSYKVRAYEHQVRDEAWPDAITGWESTGEAEYRLDDGRRVDVHLDGRMEIADSGVELKPDGTLH
jgi:hypothetical protein